MNCDEAKLVLASCRPNGADRDDPRFAEALALLQHDADLRTWFEAEQSVDKAIAAKLKAAPLPVDLLERVRAGTQARLAGRPRRTAFPLALAASLALLGLIAALWLNRPPAAPSRSFASYRMDMAEFLLAFPKLDITTDRLPDVREWLTRHNPLAKATIPKSLEQFPSIGCRSIEWEGRKLALVCFMVDGHVVHLFVMPRSAFPDAPVSATPVLARIGAQNTATWSNGEIFYLAVTQAESSLLKKTL